MREPTMSLKELEDRLCKHDHYYDAADDIKAWRNGNHERAELIVELRRWPMYIVTRLIKRCVPKDSQAAWLHAITHQK